MAKKIRKSIGRNTDATRLSMSGLPVASNLDEISLRMRVTPGLLYKMLNASGKFYKEYHIKKRSGGAREISQPNATMKAVQRWILRCIVDKLNVSESCKGFAQGQSILDNALPHSRSNAIITLDLEDFFPSIHISRVFYVFTLAGYNRNVAGILANLCCYKESLPQGSPTSPRLANLVCRRLDLRIQGYVGRGGIVYTRYADDMAFSASRSESLSSVMENVKKIVTVHPF